VRFGRSAGKTVFFFFLFLCIPFLLFPRGQRENRLTEAEILISERKYNEAITLITQVMMEKPELFDQAEALIAKIRIARMQYNNVYSELIDVYDSGDLERAYEIIKELEALDRSPNKATEQSLISARETAGFVYNQRRFLEVMQKAEEEKTRGNYSKAIDTYLEGFDIGRDLFDLENFSNVNVAQVDRETTRIANAALRIKRNLEDLAAPESQLADSLLGGDLFLFQTALRDYERIFLEIQRDRKLAYDSAILLRVLGEAMNLQRGMDKEIFHLSYLNYLTLGRTRTETEEGIVGILDLVTRNSHQRITEPLLRLVESLSNKAYTEMLSENWEESLALYEEGINYARQGVSLLGLWASRVYLDKKYNYPRQSAEVVKEYLPVMAEFSGLATLMEKGTVLLRSQRNFLNLKNTISTATTEEEYTALRRSLVLLRDSINDYKKEVSIEEERMASLIDLGYDLSKTRVYAENLISQAEELLRGSQAQEIKIVAGITSLRLAAKEEEYQSLVGRLQEATGLLEGIQETLLLAGVEETITVKYPARAKTMLQALRQDLQNFGSSLEVVGNALKSEPEDLRRGEEVLVQEERFNSLKADLNRNIPLINPLIAKADESIFLANRYRQEGLDRISEAEFLLRRNEFFRAEERLKQAVERLDLSLSYQEDATLRTLRDVRVPEISREINRIANEVVIRQVRQLITEGRSLYAQGEFQRAQNVFINAQSQWRTTNPEPNTEIETWLGYINTALYIESGRQIAETDPLYTEMIGYLNNARARFLEGRRLLDQGNRTGALALFEEAKQIIFLVQQPFPLNKEAGVLYLQILQLSDRRDFDIYFQNKFNEAVAKISRNPQEALIELQDLMEINSNYPGLSNAIYRSEVAAGIRIPPPNPADIQRSRELYNDAFEIVRNNIRAQFPLALEYLDAAIKLNPDNTEAISLKDRINRDAGGGVTVVLSSAAMEKYREAEDLYLQQRFIEAGIIIDRLLQDPRYARNPQLLDLKRSIDARR